jgi:hypothetical protein
MRLDASMSTIVGAECKELRLPTVKIYDASSKRYDSIIRVILPSRSRFVDKRDKAWGKMSCNAEAPLTLAMVTVLRKALSQRVSPSSSRWTIT